MTGITTKQPTKKPLLVLISDIHYSLPTLELADAALKIAYNKANDLGVYLVIAGDLHDTKAHLRAECVSRMLKTTSGMHSVFVVVGNHDKIHEKSDEHALEFLDNNTNIISRPCLWHQSRRGLPKGVNLIPYQHDPAWLRHYIKTMIPAGETIIMHQGVDKAKSGEYIQDKSAIPISDLAEYRVISGHYHTRQDIEAGPIKKGNIGLLSYIGNPYTMNFAEANDPAKGYQILYDDGSLEFMATDLRKHVIYETDATVLGVMGCPAIGPEDLLKIKITGSKESLSQFTHKFVSEHTGISNFRLELISTDAASSSITQRAETAEQTLVNLIDTANISAEQKTRVKELWKTSV